MRPSPLLRPALLLALCLVACARPPQPPASAAASAPDASVPPAEARGAPAPTAATTPPPATPPPATAAAGAEGRQCQQDADCALTRIDEEGCCETLCTPRVVLQSEVAGLEQSRRRCEAQGRVCPDPVCPPPRFGLSVSCQAGRCAAVRNLNE